MKIKKFEFHGFNFKRMIIGSLLAAFIGLAAAVGVGYFIVFVNHPGFYFCITMFVAYAFLLFYGRRYGNYWQVTIKGRWVEIQCDGKVKSRFSLSEIKKIEINGWFRWNPATVVKRNENQPENADENRLKISDVPIGENPYLLYFRFKNAFRKKDNGSHRSLTVTTEREKFTIVLGDSSFVNTCDKREIMIFDAFFVVLENYAIKKEFEKKDLTGRLAPPFVKSYYYLRK